MRTYLLDTCALIRAAADDEHLGRSARRVILNKANDCVLSALSLVEIGRLVASRRLSITRQNLLQTLDDLQIRLIPFRVEHAMRYMNMIWPQEHADPIDRMIIASAIEERLPVITSDRRFSGYKGLEIVW